jgi:hypothetical protein
MLASSNKKEISFSAIKSIPSTVTTSSFSSCSSRTIPKLGPAQPKPFTTNLTAGLL